MTRHPASVCAAARDAFRDVLHTYDNWPRSHDDGDPRGILARIQGAAIFHLAHPGYERETLACILGMSAVPAVLRVRARRAQEERIRREAHRP